MPALRWDFAVVSAFLRLRSFRPRLIVFEAHIAAEKAFRNSSCQQAKDLDFIRRTFDTWGYEIQPVQNNWFAFRPRPKVSDHDEVWQTDR